MIDAAVRGVTLVLRYAPCLRRRSYQHLATGSADLPHRNPVVRSGPASARALQTIFGEIKIRLLYFHALPIDIEFFGDQHREHVLDALADLGIARKESYGAIRRNPDKRFGIKRGLLASLSRSVTRRL